MINPPLNEMMQRVDCRYSLVTVVAKRARQIVEHPDLAADAADKPVSAAVDDLLSDRLAYECEGELVLGCIYVPDTDEMFLAVRGQGATLNGQPIHVSDIANPAQALAHLGYGHRVPADRERTMRLLPGLFAQISDIRRYGSAAYALCCVACGRSEIFFELGLKIYDIAAGIVIVGEAGGRISGWSADEDCRQTGNILATNSQLHGFMLNQLNA